MNQTSDATIFLRSAAGLLALLALTIAAAYVNLGSFNTAAALSISIAKALLIILFFMEVRHRSRLIWVAAVTGFFWLAIMLGLALTDFAVRAQ